MKDYTKELQDKIIGGNKLADNNDNNFPPTILYVDAKKICDKMFKKSRMEKKLKIETESGNEIVSVEYEIESYNELNGTTIAAVVPNSNVKIFRRKIENKIMDKE